MEKPSHGSVLYEASPSLAVTSSQTSSDLEQPLADTLIQTLSPEKCSPGLYATELVANFRQLGIKT